MTGAIMAAWHADSERSEIRTNGLLVAVAVGCFLTSAPVLASNNLICDASEKSAQASFEADLIRAGDKPSASKQAKPPIADDRVVDKHRLSPAIEATLRDSDEAVPSTLDNEDTEPSSPTNPPLTTRVPGLSDEAMTRYKRYMYRKDI
jgi:hypothetical protein